MEGMVSHLAFLTIFGLLPGSGPAETSETPESPEDDGRADRRRRNNDSAKRCRATRRQREFQNLLKVQVLEEENRLLREQIGRLLEELRQIQVFLLQPRVPLPS